VGLRLSAQAAEALAEPRELESFKELLDHHNLYVFTINGFPYGRFHGPGVKEKVYLPDWRESERAAYTKRLTDLLAAWLPPGVPGSISTVPVAFGRSLPPDAWEAACRNVVDVLAHLRRIRETRGAEIVLAFEPEAGCILESTEDAVSWIGRLALPPPLAELIGVCLDCCHQAVQFEEPASALRRLASGGVRIAKVQVSSSLRALPHEIPALSRFDEPAYLHQVVVRRQDGTLRRFDDLPDFLASGEDAVEECRVHFHVPIFAEHLGVCGTTRSFLEDILPRLDASVPLEVETYSFDCLPAALRGEAVADSIARELQWLRSRIDASHRRP